MILLKKNGHVKFNRFFLKPQKIVECRQKIYLSNLSSVILR